jgi:exonuclease VII small subunit
MMTMRLSPHKVSKILRGYFQGLPQTKIAKDAAVNQGSISHYASRFKERAATIGIPAAGKEYQVLNEVEPLRSLSVELYKSKLTVEEAKQGHTIIKAFQKLGISPEKHTALINVCQEVGDPGFVHAAMKLSKIEQDNHTSYEETMSKFEKIVSQLPAMEKQLETTQAEFKSASTLLAKEKQTLAATEAEFVALQKQVKTKEKKLEQQVDAKMKKAGIQNKEIEEVAELKKELAKDGLDIATLIELAKEFSYGSGKH